MLTVKEKFKLPLLKTGLTFVIGLPLMVNVTSLKLLILVTKPVIVTIPGAIVVGQFVGEVIVITGAGITFFL